jgi:hypothetical protein
MSPPPWDIFISYASEDEPFARLLYEALTRHNLKAWLFPQEVSLGENILSKIDEGIRCSRHSILLLSAAYLRKTYTVAEFNAIIKRAVDNRGGSVVPLLHDGLTQNDLANFSSFLSELRNMSTDKPVDEIVPEILKLVSPPSVNVNAEPARAVTVTLYKDMINTGKPADALDDDVRLFEYRPRIHFTNFTFKSDRDQHVRMKYDIENIGRGSANKIQCFMPGLWIDSPREPIQANHRLERSLMLCEREAHEAIMPVYAQVIVEFEDHVGNLYRQYGKVSQPSRRDGGFEYEVPELDRPYLVPQRIVSEDLQRFQI